MLNESSPQCSRTSNQTSPLALFFPRHSSSWEFEPGPQQQLIRASWWAPLVRIALKGQGRARQTDKEEGLWQDRQKEDRFPAPAVRGQAMTASDVAPLRNLMASLVCDVLKCVSIAGPCWPFPCETSRGAERSISALGSGRKAGNTVPDLSLSIAR